MVFNTTFNNISVILCRSVLLVEETGVSVQKLQTYSKSDKLSHNVVPSTPRQIGIRIHNACGDMWFFLHILQCALNDFFFNCRRCITIIATGRLFTFYKIAIITVITHKALCPQHRQLKLLFLRSHWKLWMPIICISMLTCP
jgi:hypothetical protein